MACLTIQETARKRKQIIVHFVVQHKPLVYFAGRWSQILQTDVHNLANLIYVTFSQYSNVKNSLDCS